MPLKTNKCVYTKASTKHTFSLQRKRLKQTFNLYIRGDSLADSRKENYFLSATKIDCQVESKPERPTQSSQLLTNRQRSSPFDTIAWDEHEQLVNVTTVLC
jgi:hypothetical protein